ncbi:MAG: hypothetical protein Alpg2KO_02000 [Alphaproteobacteria bacterium]
MKRKISYAILGAVLGITGAAVVVADVEAQQGSVSASRTSNSSAIDELTKVQREIVLLQRQVEVETLRRQLQAMSLEQLKIASEISEFEDIQGMSDEDKIRQSVVRELTENPDKVLALQGLAIGADGSVSNMNPNIGSGAAAGLFGDLKIVATPTPLPSPEPEIEEPEPTPTPTPEPTPETIGMFPPGGPGFDMTGMMEPDEPEDRGTPVVSSIRGTGMNMKAVILFPSGGQYILGNRDTREGWQVREVRADGVRACDTEAEDRRCTDLPFGTQPIMPPPPPQTGGFGGGFGTSGFDSTGFGAPGGVAVPLDLQ